MATRLERATSQKPWENVQTRKDYYDAFYAIRHAFINDIPPEKLDNSLPNYEQYKCTGAVIVGVSHLFEEALSKGYIKSKKSQYGVRSFLEFVRYFNFARNLPTTAQEIDTFNHALDAALRGLK